MSFFGIWNVLSLGEGCKLYDRIDSELHMGPKPQIRVLILDGHSSAALAFVRSLGRAGYWVAVGSSKGSFPPAALSRYCTLRYEYPNPINETAYFQESLREFILRNSIDVVMPMTDATVWPISSQRDQFDHHTHLILPPHQAIEISSDKFKTFCLASRLGIPAPETVLIHSLDDLRLVSEWGFPIVVKDRFSIRWTNGKGIPGSTSYIYSFTELLERVRERMDKAGDILLQKFISGVGIGFSCFVINGESFLPFQWQRIREKDPRGSGSSARQSVDLDPKVIEFSEKLLLNMGFEGISMVEFKKDGDSNLVLMEINGRPWGSMQLPIHCGIDYPLYLLRWYLENERPPKPVDYKKGITCRWLTADLVHLENLWEGKPNGWPLDYPNFWLSLLRISIPWYPRLRYDDLSFDDPKPGVAELMKWLGSHIRKDAN